MQENQNSEDREGFLEEKQPDDILAKEECKKCWRNRRKRINRIKKFILLFLLILLLFQTAICIVLCIKVYRLQEQVRVMQTSGQDNSVDQVKDDKSLAYASSKTEEAYLHKEDSEGQMPGEEHIETSGEAADTQPVNETQEGMGDQEEEKAQKEEENNNSQEDKTQKEEENNSKKDKTTEDKKPKHKAYEGKKVYLTFDDGPSSYTDEILDIFAEYQVKGTFFVIGKKDKKSIDAYKRIVREGHSLGMHSYSHKYQQIYNSLEDFDKDFTKLADLLYDTIGYVPEIFRFPGGSANRVNKDRMEEYIRYLNKNSIVYFDWNVLNGDATGVKYTTKQLTKNVLEGVEKMNTSIVLMHDTDTKGATVKSLPRLIKTLLQEGAEILPLEKNSVSIQQMKADSIK